MNTTETLAAPTPPPDDDARIERMLRDLTQNYIEDGGFTARIMGALPPPRRRAQRRRGVLLFGALLIGCAHVAVVAGPDLVAFFSAILGWLASLSAVTVPCLGSAFPVGVLACWILGLAAGSWAWGRTR